MDKNNDLDFLKKYRDTALFVLIVVAGTYAFLYVGNKFSVSDIGSGGAIGDFFGGILNPLFAIIGLFALLETIKIQSKELKTSSEALKQSSEELELTREQATLSAAALQEQSDSIKLQNFENTFFNMLNLHNEIIRSINIDTNIKLLYSDKNRVVNVKGNGILLFNNIVNILNNNYMSNIHNKEVGYESIIYKIGDDIGHYFRNMYQILKFIDSKKNIEQKHYSNILRAQLSNSELSMLFFNCGSDKGIDRFLPLVAKFEFFEHLSKTGDFPFPLIDKYIKEGYREGENPFLAFGDNKQWQKIIQTHLNQKEQGS
jgi:hypothetical protein